MTGDGEGNDEALRSMRPVWLAMRDEEPPAQGLDALLAAAGAKADQMRSKDSWSRSALVLLARPAVLAATSVIVVIGGGLLISAGLSPHASSELDVRESTPSIRQTDVRATALPVKDTERGAPTPSEPAARAAGSNRAERVQPARMHRGPQVPSPDSEQENTERPAADDPVAEPSVSQAGGVLIGEDVGAVRNAPRSAERRDPNSGANVEQLVKPAILAASNKDCPAGREIAERIKKLDTNGYRTRVVTQPAIAICLQ